MSSEREDRIETLQEIQNRGGNPFKYEFSKERSISELLEFEGDEEEALPEKDFSTAGRVSEIRNFGGIAFLDLRGEEAEIQVVLRKEKHIELLEEKINTGDIVGVKGNLIYTDKGEFSIEVSEFQLLTKGVRPIPSDFYGLEDQELKYRERSLHLISDMEARQVFKTRSKIISQVRRFLEDKDFMEVETPIIQPVYGGAAAEPFTTHIEDKDMDAYLRISPELYLKRLVIGGFERVFEIGKDFRNESIDTTHNPEFTMMEIYQAYADYEDMMELTEKLYENVAEQVLGETEVEYQGQKLDFSAPWKRMTVKEAIKKHGGFDVGELSDEEIKEKMEENEAKLDS
ncbi:MAG: amino acid--tRNA ligase-related protein, partial [Candidatus Nanohaloarchaea archaeon]